MIAINKAVIPVAGLGTRMLPASSTVSKCLFPIVDKPVIHYVVEEAIASGIEQIVLVVGSNREAIERYFTDHNQPHLAQLKKQCEFQFVVQEKLDGLGGAVKCARDFIGDNRFAVLLGDTILRGQPPVTAQLIGQMSADTGAVIGVEHVAPELVSRYGIVAVEPLTAKLFAVTDLVEKPAQENAPSSLAIAARYILDTNIFDALDATVADSRGEIQLTQALKILAQQKPVLALQFEGQRFDIGNKLDFLKTNITFTLDDPKLNHELKAWLLSILADTSESTD